MKMRVTFMGTAPNIRPGQVNTSIYVELGNGDNFVFDMGEGAVANNSRYTQRFATHVGKLCRDMPNKAVAEMERLHHGTVKALDTLYMQEQVDRAGLPAPRAIGVDEISIRKGHNYRVIVSDLERARPIWVGGEGRKETDIDLFFKALGGKKSARTQPLR